MLKVGNGHNHRIHILAVEQGSVIARGGNVRSVCLLPGSLVHVIEVCDAHQFAGWHVAG